MYYQNIDQKLLTKLIEESYSEDEAVRWSSYKTNNADEDVIIKYAKVVLQKITPSPMCCAPMSALWAALIRDNTSIPVHAVAGFLDLKGRRLFGNDLEEDKVKTIFSNSNFNWDGHCWVMFGDLIGEISLFRTAYAEGSPKWLKDAIIELFGAGRWVLLQKSSNIEASFGLRYKPKYILTDSEISSLLKGADAAGILKD